MVTKAHQRANAILRSFVSRDVALLVRAFIVYVRPLVEYNSVIGLPRMYTISNKLNKCKEDLTSPKKIY